MPRPLNRRAALTALAGGALSGLAGCHTGQAGAAPGTATIMIIRHAEKPPASAAPYGVQADGTQDGESLTTVGWARAGALAGLFAPRTATGAFTQVRDGLLRPTTIFAADPGAKGSKRPQQTVTALAALLGLTPDLTYRKGDEADLAGKLHSVTGAVLVAWEHESIGDILAGLGTITPAPPTDWPDPRFDVVYVLTGSGSAWSFRQVPQMLLAGDSAHPID